MATIKLVIGILLLVMALFLIVSILMQSGKSKKLSGTIAGGAETFLGKQKGQALNKTLSKVTNVVAIVFVVLVFSLLFIDAKDNAEANKKDDSSVTSSAVDASKDDASKDDASKDDASKDAASKDDASKDAASKVEDSSAVESVEAPESTESTEAAESNESVENAE